MWSVGHKMEKLIHYVCGVIRSAISFWRTMRTTISPRHDDSIYPESVAAIMDMIANLLPLGDKIADDDSKLRIAHSDFFLWKSDRQPIIVTLRPWEFLISRFFTKRPCTGSQFLTFPFNVHRCPNTAAERLIPRPSHFSPRPSLTHR